VTVAGVSPMGMDLVFSPVFSQDTTNPTSSPALRGSVFSVRLKLTGAYFPELNVNKCDKYDKCYFFFPSPGNDHLTKPPAPKPASPPALRCARITCNNPKQLEPLALLSLQSTVPSLASFHGPYHPFKTDLYKNLAL
jgi:hypothetical protein